MNIDVYGYLQKESQMAFERRRCAVVSFDFECEGKLAKTISFGINENGEISRLWWPRKFGVRYLIREQEKHLARDMGWKCQKYF